MGLVDDAAGMLTNIGDVAQRGSEFTIRYSRAFERRTTNLNEEIQALSSGLRERRLVRFSMKKTGA